MPSARTNEFEEACGQKDASGKNRPNVEEEPRVRRGKQPLVLDYRSKRVLQEI
jgi:hypothetical protein